MSYEWIRHRKRYLSFRYLFPELVVPWIQFKRGLLRIVWFFTHPIDEFIEDLGELIAWPLVTVARFFAWILASIGEFFQDLFAGIEAAFSYLGRLPVWTGAAIAGSLGIIMTILLFFLQVATFEPVPLSASIGLPEPPPVAADPAPQPVSQPILTLPPVEQEQPFDPFQKRQTNWEPTVPHQPSDGLSIDIERLEIPFDSRQRIHVVSVPSAASPQPWTHFERISAMQNWSLTRMERAQRQLRFTPYVMRQGAHTSQVAPSWVTTAASISPYLQVQSRREPAVSISRSAPTAATLGETLQYELVVSNLGADTLDSVTINEAVSAIDRVVDVQPPAQVIDDALVWNVTNLQPGEQRRLTIEIRPDQLVPISGGSTVRVKTGVAAVSHVTQPTETAPPITPEPKPELNVVIPKPEPKPEPVNIGMILPTFNEEPEPQPEPPPQQVEPTFTFEPLPARPAKPAPAIMPLPREIAPSEPIVEQQPMQKSEMTVTAGGVPIYFEMRTPTEVAVDGRVPTVFEIRNPGRAELTNIVILVEVTGELDHERGRTLEHHVAKLAPGGVYFTRLTTTAVRDGVAKVQSTLTSAEDLKAVLKAKIDVNRPARQLTQLNEADLIQNRDALPDDNLIEHRY